MKIFSLRFTVFVTFWLLIILLDSINIPLSITLFALSLAIYFFLSVKRRLLFLYSMLSCIVFIHGCLLTDNSSLSLLLLLFITMEAAISLMKEMVPFYLAMNILLSLSLIWLNNGHLLETIIISLLFSFLVLKLNHMTDERREQREIYDQLLGEYRNLKRMNLAAEQNARLEERTKIARDIHDSVGHRLTALIMKLETLAIETKHPGYTTLKQMANESLEETRQAVKALKTDEQEGIATVVHLIRKLEAESHLLVQFTIKQGILSVPLSNEKSIILYRVIQEALTNAMRHAQSREVHVTLGKSAAGAISFEITNAIHDAKPLAYGFGLTNMQKRVEEVEGFLDVYQTDETFVVKGTIPGS
ncbi:Signal transduction histidine kinase [Lentibacillus halodurans]|uniref:histidine kinase n=1 Tax=Lentibacillus halodurans TaxID=237679 RepID=A0A1I1A3V6_9BACI|nr:sensor histidine kinase [Lentibacillus halodurans]SFB31258.1 Signal transduction histidine kinase [Lentibacillus halodurans]